MKSILMKLSKVKVLEFNKPNRNGRIYLEDCIDLDSPIIKEQLDSKMLLGQYGFLDNNELDMTKVSHSVTALYKENECLYADIDILNTPAGRQLIENLNESNFRTRGNGTIDPETGVVIGYSFEGIDYIDYPA